MPLRGKGRIGHGALSAEHQAPATRLALSELTSDFHFRSSRRGLRKLRSVADQQQQNLARRIPNRSVRFGGGFPLEQCLAIFRRRPDALPEHLEVNWLFEKSGWPRLGLASRRRRSIKGADDQNRDISRRGLSRQDFTDHETVQVWQHQVQKYYFG